MPTIKAHFDGRTIVPDRPLDLVQGQPLIVHFEPAPQGGPPEDPSEHFLDWVVQNLVDHTATRTDGADEHDHYLYGTPKRKGKAGWGWRSRISLTPPSGSHC